MGKVYLFSSALSAEFYGLAIIAALNSALACAYYFRVPVAMFFQDEGGAAGDSAATSRGEIKVAPEAGLAIALCAAAVVLFGLFPEPLLRLVRSAALGMGKI
jgi:NADH-quinone oxidoreductase subunit N